MLDGLLNLILSIFFWLASLVTSIFTAPILGITKVIWPNLDSYLSTTVTFWNRLLTGVGFAKEVFLNVTGFPRALLNLIITYFFARFSLTATKRAFKFIANVYYFIRGQRSGDLQLR